MYIRSHVRRIISITMNLFLFISFERRLVNGTGRCKSVKDTKYAIRELIKKK
jgi:hypothetical protein